MVKRADFARLPCRRVVILADPRRGIAVLLQNFGQCSGAFRNDACVAVIARRRLSNHSRSCHMVVAACQQRGPGGRAQRGCVKADIAQTLRGQFFHIGRRHTAAERTKLSKTHVVKQNQQNVWRAFWWSNNLGKGRRIGILIGAAYLALETKVGPRQGFRRRRWRRGSSGGSASRRDLGRKRGTDRDKQCEK